MDGERFKEIHRLTGFVSQIINRNKQDLLIELLDGAIKNEYHEIPEYSKNINSLQREVSDQ